MHVGRGNIASKTEAIYFLSTRQNYLDRKTSNFTVDDTDTGSISFTESSRYLVYLSINLSSLMLTSTIGSLEPGQPLAL
jgi:hypothetical protein